MECATICYSRSHFFPMHLHPDLFTFSYILGGSARLILKNASIILKENDFVIIPPYVAHQTQIDDFFYYKVIRVPKSYSFIEESNDDSRVMVIPNGFTYKPHFDAWFDSIQQNPVDLMASKAEPLDVPDIFKGYLKNPSSNTDRLQELLKTTIIHFETNYNRPILVEELSDLTYLSESHLQRLFKNKVGISPMRYLLNLRIEKAKAYIKTNDRFTDIAYDTGFYDQSHFNKYFKMNVGMTPKRYAGLIKND
ncbi:AraC-like DNA-binding protein [Flavobacteriaceae bacterium MAR_2010_72]|nr:AraC-like DNA-binding protein [Flavobacteriaceae bacterium MAR_2010_72]